MAPSAPTEIAPARPADAGLRVDIEARIAADPADTEAYAVYADWLQGQGDPRGELIALQLARDTELAGDPKSKRAATLQRAIARHVEHHAAALFGELAALSPDVRDLGAGPLIWRLGFVHRVELDPRPGADLGAIVDEVLRHPSGRFVRELAIRCDELDEAHRVVDVVRAQPRPALRELDLRVRDERLDLSALWPAVPALRRISVVARAFDLGAVRAPAAERVRLAATRLSADHLRSLTTAPWPALQRLELRFGGRFEPSSTTLEDLAPLIVRSDLPALTHLKLRGCEFAGEALVALATSALAAQLVVVDLTGGHVEQDDLRRLAHHTASFPRLRELWLPSVIASDAQKRLAGIATHVISDHRSALDTFADEVARRAHGVRPRS